KLGKLNKSPAEYVATLAEFINKFPWSERAASSFFSVRTVLKNAKDADEVRNLSNKLMKDTEQVPAAIKIETYRYIGEALYNQGLYVDSAAVARKVIGLFDEAAYMEFKRKQNEFFVAEQTARNSNFKVRPFDEERAKTSYVGVKTGTHNLLAKSLWEQRKFEEAEKAYRDSFAIKVSKESALGIAKSTEKNGKDDE